jgi:hypothetical protein
VAEATSETNRKSTAVVIGSTWVVEGDEMTDGQQAGAYLFWVLVWVGWLTISIGVALYQDMLGGIIMGGVGTIVWALLGLASVYGGANR